MKRPIILTLAALVVAALVFPTPSPANYADTLAAKYSEGPIRPSDGIAGKKLVCITFDDGWQDQYDNALPILVANGFKASFAVVTGWIGGGSGSGQAMDLAELRALVSQGMDIASHTRTHPQLPKLDTADLQDEIDGSKTILEDEGFSVRMLVYPYFEPMTENTTVQTAVVDAGYLCARSGCREPPHPYEPGNRPDPNAQYYIDAVQIGTDNFTVFKNAVDAATDHSVISLCYHHISDNTSLGVYRTPIADFEAQMQYLKEGGFEVALLPDLVQNAWITLNPTSMGFCSIQGSHNPATQALNITNTGGGTLTWTASANAGWLALEPTGGTAPGTVTVTANTAGLAAGSYSCNITVSAANATNAPQTVPVTLDIRTPSPGWLAGWSYRRQFTVSGSTAGAQTDYPLKLTINRSTGTDSGSTVYLGTGCEDDYRDIRFTGCDGTTLLDYWIESDNSSSATVWVELDATPSPSDTGAFNLYYGNSGASSASNMVNTFTFADDFEEGSLDAARWTPGGSGSGSVVVGGGVLTVTAGDSESEQRYAASKLTYNNAYSLHTRAKLNSVTITDNGTTRLAGFITTRGSSSDKHLTTAFRWYKFEPNFCAVSGNDTAYSQPDMNVPTDIAYHVSECRRYSVGSSNYDSFIIDGGTAVSGTRPCATARYIYILSEEHGKSIIVDWVFLRKFVYPEPACSAWGNEETPLAVTTGNANGIRTTSALLTGILNYCGGIDGQYRFCLGTSPDSYTRFTDWSSGTITTGQPFSDNVTGLTSGLQYYYIAECTNSLGTGAGEEKSFTTLSAPTLTTDNATSIMATTAILHGTLTSTGGAVTNIAIFSGTEECVLCHSDNFSMTGAGPFSLGVTGLEPEETYYYRCYAENLAGGNWSPSSSSFTTQEDLGLWRNYWEGPGKDWWRFSSGCP